jgi:hypothetical protein
MRYRTTAEALGILLVKEAQRQRLNVMLETSGRDIGSFAYVDFLFSVIGVSALIKLCGSFVFKHA